MTEKKKGRSPRKQGYTTQSPAVCVVLYDLTGRPMPDKIATEFVNHAATMAEKYGYVIHFCRQ